MYSTSKLEDIFKRLRKITFYGTVRGLNMYNVLFMEMNNADGRSTHLLFEGFGLGSAQDRCEHGSRFRFERQKLEATNLAVRLLLVLLVQELLHRFQLQVET